MAKLQRECALLHLARSMPTALLGIPGADLLRLMMLLLEELRRDTLCRLQASPHVGRRLSIIFIQRKFKRIYLYNPEIQKSINRRPAQLKS